MTEEVDWQARAQRLEARIIELKDSLDAIREVLITTGSNSPVAKMIIATCDSALRTGDLHDETV